MTCWMHSGYDGYGNYHGDRKCSCITELEQIVVKLRRSLHEFDEAIGKFADDMRADNPEVAAELDKLRPNATTYTYSNTTGGVTYVEFQPATFTTGITSGDYTYTGTTIWYNYQYSLGNTYMTTATSYPTAGTFVYCNPIYFQPFEINPGGEGEETVEAPATERPQAVTMPNGQDGFCCLKCNEFSPYVEANTPGGFVCGKCR